MHSALTLKQAKAQHKARSKPAVSEREFRQLQRESLLDERAWSAKERAKHRLVAAQKRLEQQERARREDATRGFATQMRCDRFGHKSSQFHLGAFFTKVSELAQPLRTDEHTRAEIDALKEEEEEDDDDIDDEDLLSILQRNGSTDIQDIRPAEVLPVVIDGDNVNWDDFLETGTQLERELRGSMGIAQDRDSDSMTYTLRQPSFDSFDSSYSLGLTTQDMEDLDPTTRSRSRPAVDQAVDRKLMPPPLLPPAASPPDKNVTDSACRGTAQPEYSLTQLERFVEDDITLSQQ